MAVTKQIEALEVVVQPHGARANLKLMRKVGRAVAPALARAPDELSEDMDVGEISAPLGALFDALDDKSMDALLLDLFATTQVVKDGAVIDLRTLAGQDKAFGENARLLLQVAWFVLEVNLGGFTGGASSGIGEALGKILTAGKASLYASTATSPTATKPP